MMLNLLNNIIYYILKILKYSCLSFAWFLLSIMFILLIIDIGLYTIRLSIYYTQSIIYWLSIQYNYIILKNYGNNKNEKIISNKININDIQTSKTFSSDKEIFLKSKLLKLKKLKKITSNELLLNNDNNEKISSNESILSNHSSLLFTDNDIQSSPEKIIIEDEEDMSILNHDSIILHTKQNKKHNNRHQDNNILPMPTKAF